MTTAAHARVDVQVAATGDGIPDVATIRRWIRRAIDGAGNTSDVEVSVRVVDRAEMQVLNRRFRNKDRPTNVLSFPAGPIVGLPEGAAGQLGDVVVCAAVVADEAEGQGKPLAEHWAHMLVHGTLHLMGYDHEHADDARVMESLEAKILEMSGISDPYRSPG